MCSGSLRRWNLSGRHLHRFGYVQHVTLDLNTRRSVKMAPLFFIAARNATNKLTKIQNETNRNNPLKEVQECGGMLLLLLGLICVALGTLSSRQIAETRTCAKACLHSAQGKAACERDCWIKNFVGHQPATKKAPTPAKRAAPQRGAPRKIATKKATPVMAPKKAARVIAPKKKSMGYSGYAVPHQRK
jgi:hypothetical protein